ncbi:MAG: Magnesium and cobalt efflux protein CorC [Myxococcaceae bacterium]|nr:Magnesium and cobalt efflux protein CorC [Myxococcaceae bacterium]
MLALFAAFVCVLANGFFVAAEFALVKVRPTALEARAAAGDRKAILGLEAIRNLDAYLGATQLGITLASLALGWLGEPAISTIVEPLLMEAGLPESYASPIGLTIAFAIITLLHIVMGELAPKSLAIQYADKVVLFSARAMHAFHAAAYPFLYVLNGSANLLLRGFGLGPPDHAAGAPSAEELRLIVQTSFRAGGLDGTQRDLLERVLRGSGRSVRAIMVPRVDMSVLSIEADLTTTEARMRREAYSRYPLSENNDPDRIVGYLYAKDVWTAPHPQRGRIEQLRRDILFVPESRTVAEMLEDFRTSHTPIAIVVDEYGGTSGLVTLEDCVEEIVGDIRDETDDEPVRTLIRPDGSVVVDGSSPFADLEVEELRDLVQDQDETVGAFVIERLGRLPKPGDRVRIGEYEAVVEVVRRRRVSRVVFRVAEKSSPDPLPHVDG